MNCSITYYFITVKLLTYVALKRNMILQFLSQQQKVSLINSYLKQMQLGISFVNTSAMSRLIDVPSINNPSKYDSNYVPGCRVRVHVVKISNYLRHRDNKREHTDSRRIRPGLTRRRLHACTHLRNKSAYHGTVRNQETALSN